MMDSFIVYLILFSIIVVLGQAFQKSVVIHTLTPQMGWPLAYVLGAIVSPPDNVAISLAAALAIPSFTFQLNNVDVHDLFVFIVVCVIFATLVLQGLSLPLIIKKFGIHKVGESERYKEHITELQTRVQMINAALRWLQEYKAKIKKDKKLLGEVSMCIYEYQILKKRLESRISDHDDQLIHDEESELKEKLNELTESVDSIALKKLLRKSNEFTWMQRLGYLLEHLGHNELAAVIYQYIKNQKTNIVPLVPYASITRAQRSTKWRVGINAIVESDTN